MTVADDIESHINRLCKRLQVDPIDGTVHGMAMEGKDVHNYYIFYDIKTLTVNIVVHEISHVIDSVFSHRQIDDGEARAFLTGHITEELLKWLYKKQLIRDKWIKYQTKSSLESKP